ncbi:MAG: L-seryl-tRNA(Sec) selenium transferase, partial [Firmicutes bacterium]|nr:L-seryl-tRNA(Sec) selenium transferase [Bacillota bacterium]
SSVPASLSVDELAIRLRRAEPAVVARVQEGQYQLDLRTVQPEEVDLLAEVMAAVINAGEGPR